jgi:hypothetical protein
VFNSDAAVAALLSRNNIRDWGELNPQQTGLLLQQTERDKQAATLALAQIGLQQMGETDRTKRALDYNKWETQERLKQGKRDRSLALIGGLSALSGVGTAGRRLGISPTQMASVDPNSMLQSLNAMVGGLGQYGNSSTDYARYFQQASQYVPAMARTGQ